MYRTHDERGVPLVWLLKVPLYGECDAGAIFYRTLRKQLKNQSFVPSEMDSCYFTKILEDRWFYDGHHCACGRPPYYG